MRLTDMACETLRLPLDLLAKLEPVMEKIR